ncbi:MAG TPA: SMR family transporter [Phycisphaerae bacterium]|nr:SMR family transporter [Phycisphaerae bacterium]HOJ72301.1 SMR family transporter [Phycisphaerae bacterium]HOM50037.1 SMR family transporter [Phycisphaerae bacterium]HON68433.1 SMR family transporter [Phycisphaerae bacterium]HOQ85724.1 SMR family transporter [Phycisphaerae bacterium]
MRYVIALLIALLLNAGANLMMKFGAKRLAANGGLIPGKGVEGLINAVTSNWVLILGLFCFATNVIFYTYALKRIPISLAYPIMVGAGFAIIAVVAWRYLGETLSVGQWLGVSLILAGIILVAREMRTVAGS